MSLFKRKTEPQPTVVGSSPLAEMALATIHDGVIITDRNGQIQFINPAAVTMTECGSAENALGLDYGLLLKVESKEGRELSEAENLLIQAMRTGQPLDRYVVCLIAGSSNKRIPIAVSMAVAAGDQSRIITFRNVTKELAEESEQAEFISTASHEMRTPVASRAKAISRWRLILRPLQSTSVLKVILLLHTPPRNTSAVCLKIYSTSLNSMMVGCDRILSQRKWLGWSNRLPTAT